MPQSETSAAAADSRPGWLRARAAGSSFRTLSQCGLSSPPAPRSIPPPDANVVPFPLAAGTVYTRPSESPAKKGCPSVSKIWGSRKIRSIETETLRRPRVPAVPMSDLVHSWEGYVDRFADYRDHRAGVRYSQDLNGAAAPNLPVARCAALHHMPGAAGRLRPLDRRRRNLKVKRGRPLGAANAVRLGAGAPALQRAR
jgi:hypothetical protein